MHIVSGTASGALRLASLGRELSPNARRRLKWMDYYQSHGHNARLTCRHFDISPQTLYRWLRRYSPRDLATLEERPRRPHRTRRPTWSPQLAHAVALYFMYYNFCRVHQTIKTTPAVASGLADHEWTVEVHSRATAATATTFLNAIQARMPFPVRGIQVDGGSEFQAAFETECQRRQIRLFVLPPRSPKLNGHVERAQRTPAEEFYEVWDLTWTVAELPPKSWPGNESTTPSGPISPSPTAHPSNSFSRSSPLPAARSVTNVPNEYTALAVIHNRDKIRTICSFPASWSAAIDLVVGHLKASNP